MPFISKKELERLEIKAFNEGFDKGYKHGRVRTISEKITPNMLREYLGLPPLNETGCTTERNQ